MIFYYCNFDLTRPHGKERATLHKIQALEKKVPGFECYSNFDNKIWRKLFKYLMLEIIISFRMIKSRPRFLISRSNNSLLANCVAKVLGVTTVREIHAYAKEELGLLDVGYFRKKYHQLMHSIAHKIDVSADIRIFNHPKLLDWYKERGMSGESDIYVYNGYSISAKSDLNKSAAREKYSLTEDVCYLVFIGSASIWHGVDYLVSLQEQFNLHQDNIKIVCGGSDVSRYDVNNICINITPLNDVECAQLIAASDYCLLPVKKNRVSPGSPLKLYDYIVNERRVICQESVAGYSDEVERYGIGLCVDFTCAEAARAEVVDWLKSEGGINKAYPKCPVSWDDRIDAWLSGIGYYEYSKPE